MENVNAPVLKKIGKYEVVRELGRGATCTVYLANDPFVKRQVAIKLINPDALRHPIYGKLYRKQLFTEAALAGKLIYPHIVAIYDAVLGEDESYIVMEYVSGGTLERYTHVDNLMPLDRLMEIIFKCCRALSFANSFGVIHRDIKPANIMLGGSDNIKISDFGAALIPQGDTTQVTGIGSLAYMSPEQLREEKLSHQTDIFSLGVVMYELLTGKRPFNGATNASMIYQILNIDPPSPSTFRPEIPPGLEKIVVRATQKELSARYQNWEEFAQDLANIGDIPSSKAEIAVSEQFNTLKKQAFFKDFNDVELWEVLRISAWSRLPPKAVMIREGNEGDSFYVLASGEAKVTKGKKLLNTLKSGDCFGEMAYLSRRAAPRTASVEAVTEVTVIKIEAASLDQASENCQLAFNKAFLRILVERLTQASAKLSQVLS